MLNLVYELLFHDATFAVSSEKSLNIVNLPHLPLHTLDGAHNRMLQHWRNDNGETRVNCNFEVRITDKCDNLGTRFMPHASHGHAHGHGWQ